MEFPTKPLHRKAHSKWPSKARDIGSVAGIVQGLLRWFSSNARDLPWRRTRDPYAVWISEIMLQQTQVSTVIPYWERWMQTLPDIESLAACQLDRLYKLWEGLGYYSRVRHLQRAAQVIVTKHQGVFPTAFDEVLDLPGIGRYTAGALCSIAFNQAVPIVDGNVIRVLTRLFGIRGNPRTGAINARLWRLAEKLVRQAQSEANLSEAPCSTFNQSLMELGAIVCLPRNPRCEECPVRKHCIAHETDQVDLFPQPLKRPSITHRHFVAFIVEKNRRFLVQRRPAGVVNAGLWEFPNTEVNGKHTRRGEPFEIVETVPVCRIKHSITRYRILLEAFRATLSQTETAQRGEWKDLSELQRLAFPSAHKKILAAIAR